MKKIIIVAILTFIISIILCSCACEHEWIDATCTEPQKCSLCDETQGEPLNHNWQDATCTDPKTCSLCGETNGESLGHSESELELKEHDYAKAISIYIKKCTICNEELEKVEENIESLHNGELFIISPADFKKRLTHVYYEINKDMFIRSGTTFDKKFVCGFSLDNEDLGYLFFKNNKDTIKEDQKDEACFNGLQGTISGEITLELISIIKTCDPTIDTDQARSYAFDLILDGEKEVNGIVYQFKKGSSNNGVVMVDITE